MISISEDVYNKLDWKPVHAHNLDKLLEGLTVVGSEPIDYPLTDGLIIYFKDASGHLTALDIGADAFVSGDDENPFYTHLAEIPT